MIKTLWLTYGKSVTAVVTAVVSAVVAAYTGDHHVDLSEWSTVILAAAGAAAVFTAPNVPGARSV